MDGMCSANSANGGSSRAADEVRKPVKKSSESPGRKNPKNRPDSAKMIAVTTGSAAAPAFSNHHSGLRNSRAASMQVFVRSLGQLPATVASTDDDAGNGAIMLSVLRDDQMTEPMTTRPATTAMTKRTRCCRPPA